MINMKPRQPTKAEAMKVTLDAASSVIDMYQQWLSLGLTPETARNAVLETLTKSLDSNLAETNNS